MTTWVGKRSKTPVLCCTLCSHFNHTLHLVGQYNISSGHRPRLTHQLWTAIRTSHPATVVCCETDLAADQSTGCRTWNRRSRQTRSGDKTNSERKWKARKEKRRVKWHRFREGRTCSCCHHLPTCAVASVLSHTKHAAGSVDEKVARTSTRCYFQWKSRLFILDTQPCRAAGLFWTRLLVHVLHEI